MVLGSRNRSMAKCFAKIFRRQAPQRCKRSGRIVNRRERGISSNRRARIPRAHVLADVAAKNIFAHLRAKRFWHDPAQFDIQIRNATPCVQHILFSRRNQRLRRTGFDASRARSAAVRGRGIRLKLKRSYDFPQKKPRSQRLIDQTRIFANPSQPGRARITALQQRSRIHANLELMRFDFSDFLRQPLQTLSQDLMIIPPPRVLGNEGAICGNLVIQLAHANHRSRVFDQAARIAPHFRAPVRQVAHLARHAVFVPTSHSAQNHRKCFPRAPRPRVQTRTPAPDVSPRPIPHLLLNVRTPSRGYGGKRCYSQRVGRPFSLAPVSAAVAFGLLSIGILHGQKPWREYPAVEYNDFPRPPDYQVPAEWTFARLMFPGGLSMVTSPFSRRLPQGAVFVDAGLSSRRPSFRGRTASPEPRRCAFCRTGGRRRWYDDIYNFRGSMRFKSANGV